MDYQVVIVDDELLIGKALVRLFRQHEIEALHVSSAEECLDALVRFNLKVALVDQAMPGLSGTDLLKRLKNFYPDTMRIMLTGIKELELIYQAVNQTQVFRFFLKPWDDQELVDAVKQAIRLYDLAENNRKLTDELSRKNYELEQRGEAMNRALASQIRSEQRLQSLLDSLPSAVLLYDQSKQIIEHNSTFMEWFNKGHSLVGMEIDSLPGAIEAIADNPGWHELAFEDQAYEFYVTSVSVDGELHWVIVANHLGNDL